MSVAVVSDSLWPHELSSLLCPWDFPGKNTVVGCHFLLQEIFPTQGSNLGLPHCRPILYHLSQIRKKYQIPQPHHYRLYQKTLNQKNENHALSHKPSNHWKWVWVGTSLVVQWLGLWASNAGGTGSIPGWGTQILHAVQCGHKQKRGSGCGLMMCPRPRQCRKHYFLRRELAMQWGKHLFKHLSLLL